MSDEEDNTLEMAFAVMVLILATILVAVKETM